MADRTQQTHLLPAEDDRTPERRHGDRVPVRLRISVKSAEADFIEMRSNDLSDGGMFVTAQEPLRLGTLVRIRRSNGVNIDGVGRVAWVRALDQSSVSEPPGMGIKFIRLSAQSKKEIAQLAASPSVEPSLPAGSPAPAEALSTPPPSAAPREQPSGVRSIQRSLPPVSPAVLARSALLCAEPASQPSSETETVRLPPPLLSPRRAPRARTPLFPFSGNSPLPPDYGMPPRSVSPPTQEPSARRARKDSSVGAPDASEYLDVTAYVEDAEDMHDDEWPPVPQAVAASPNPPPEVRRRRLPLGRQGAVAGAAALALAALAWGAWPNTPPTPKTPKPILAAQLPTAPEPPPPVAVAVVTQPEGAEIFVGDSLRGRAPLELQLQADTPVTLRAHAAGYADARVEWTKGTSQGPVRLELKPLPHVLHVETDPPGGWIAIAGQRAYAPADIELPNFDGKRVGVTAGLYRYLDNSAYVLPSEFIETDTAIRAEVKLKLKFDGQSATGSGTAPAAPAAKAAPALGN